MGMENCVKDCSGNPFATFQKIGTESQPGRNRIYIIKSVCCNETGLLKPNTAVNLPEPFQFWT